MTARLRRLRLRSLHPLLAALALGAPWAADAQPRLPRLRAEPRLPADLREVRLRSAERRRPPSHRPPPLAPRRVQPVLIVVGPYGTAFAACGGAGVFAAPVYASGSCVAPGPSAVDAPPAVPRAPRTKVIAVAAADTTCGDAVGTRALVECLGAAVRREDARLAVAERLAREPLALTRPAPSVAAFDRAAQAWQRYRDEECRAQALAIGGGSAAAYEGLACQLRLARERRAALEAGTGAGATARPDDQPLDAR